MDTKHILWSYSFPMKKGILDDIYYFYEDGRILHFYDKTISKLNIEEFVTADFIPMEQRIKMLSECPEDKKERIATFLHLPS